MEGGQIAYTVTKEIVKHQQKRQETGRVEIQCLHPVEKQQKEQVKKMDGCSACLLESGFCSNQAHPAIVGGCGRARARNGGQSAVGTGNEQAQPNTPSKPTDSSLRQATVQHEFVMGRYSLGAWRELEENVELW